MNDQDVINSIVDFVRFNTNIESSLTLNLNLSKLVFIPSVPYDSKEISEANQNLWELHELNPKDQEIKIVINP